jgi:hypothetical protein
MTIKTKLHALAIAAVFGLGLGMTSTSPAHAQWWGGGYNDGYSGSGYGYHDGWRHRGWDGDRDWGYRNDWRWRHHRHCWLVRRHHRLIRVCR